MSRPSEQGHLSLRHDMTVHCYFQQPTSYLAREGMSVTSTVAGTESHRCGRKVAIAQQQQCLHSDMNGGRRHGAPCSGLGQHWGWPAGARPHGCRKTSGSAPAPQHSSAGCQLPKSGCLHYTPTREIPPNSIRALARGSQAVRPSGVMAVPQRPKCLIVGPVVTSLPHP